MSGFRRGTDVWYYTEVEPGTSVEEAFAVHGTENLHLCDASVFPTSVGVNPQLTIMALAVHAPPRILRGSGETEWLQRNAVDLLQRPRRDHLHRPRVVHGQQACGLGRVRHRPGSLAGAAP